MPTARTTCGTAATRPSHWQCPGPASRPLLARFPKAIRFPSPRHGEIVSLTVQMAQHVMGADDADEIRMLIDDVKLVHVERQQLFDDQLDWRMRRYGKDGRCHNVGH